MTPTEQAEAANFLAQLATIPGFDHPDLHRWVAALRAAPQAEPSDEQIDGILRAAWQDSTRYVLASDMRGARAVLALGSKK